MAATPADGDGGTAAAAVRHSKEKQQNKSGKASTTFLATEKANERFFADNEGQPRMKTSKSFAGQKKKSFPPSKAQKRGKKNPKAQARDIRRLLLKKRETLPAAVAEELEERAARLEKEAHQARKEAKRKRFFLKRKTLYDKIRFYEAQKVRRRLKATRQLLQQLLKQQRQELHQQKDSSLVESEALKASIAEQRAALASHLSDLTYILHYPADEPYIALFPCGGLVSKETEQKREAMRLKIRQQIIEERLGALGSAADEDDPSGGFMLSAAEARQAAAATAAAAAVPAEGCADVPNKNNGNSNLQREETAAAASDDKEEKCSNQNVEDAACTVTALFEQAPELSDAEERPKPHLKMPRKTRVPSQTLHSSSSSFTSSAPPRKNPDFSGRRQGGSKHAPSWGEKRGPARVISDKSRRPTTEERKTTHFPERKSFPAANSRNTATRWFPREKGGNKQGHVHTAASVGERRSATTGSKREIHSNSLDDKTERSSRHEAEDRKKRKLGSGPSDSSFSFSSSGSPSGVALPSAPKRIGLSKSAAVGSHVIFESDSD